MSIIAKLYFKLLLTIFLVIFVSGSCLAEKVSTGTNGDSQLTDNIDWLGHASFRVRGSSTIYFDPWKIDGSPRDGDIIVITHGHYDHFSIDDILKVAKPDAKIFVPKMGAENFEWPDLKYVSPDQSYDVGDVTIRTVKSYNIDTQYHPKENDWVGYIVTVDGVNIYHAGDTDVIDEMKNIRCDVALLPVSGTYVMTALEALEAVRRIQPKVAIPMHWGEIIGTREDAETFSDDAICKVVIKDVVK
jgi:L-ascorbate metabolism protein UlaG (beta-lactamase superfamily)